MINYPYDLHTHTRLSDGWDTVRGNVRAAEACGMQAVAITDHLFSSSDTDLVDRLLEEVSAARRESPIHVLAGVEGVTLDSSGHTSVTPETAGRLDLVLVDFGERTKGIGCDAPSDKGQAVATVVRAVAGLSALSYVHVLAHPLNLGRLDIALRLDDLPPSALGEMAEAMAEGEVAFELMNQFHYWWPDVPVDKLTARYVEIVALFAEKEVRFSMGSDAHRTGSVGNLAWSLRVAEAVGLTDAQMFVPPLWGVSGNTRG